MAWTTPRCWTTGEVVTAALLNAQIKGNMDLTAPAKLTTAGDMLYATGANATARLAKGTNGNIMHQASCAPAWTACPSIAGITLSGALDANGTVDADVTDFDVLSSGDIDLVSSANAAAAVYIAQSTGTSGTIKIHADTGTSVTEGAESINILSDAGGVGIRSTANLANAINITNDGGTTGTISIFNDQGSSVTEGAESISLLSDAGGVGIRSTANLANAVNITADGGTTSTIQIFNDQGTAVNEGVASIQLLSDVGGIGIKSGLNAAGAIRLTADAGTSETIMLHADQGSGTGSICLTSDAGGITLNPATFLTVGGNAANAGEIRIMEDSDAGCHYAAIKAQNMAASYTLTLPADDGCCGEVLTTNGSGTLTWAAAGGGPCVANGVNNRVATFSGACALNGEANLTFTGSLLTVTGNLALTNTDGGSSITRSTSCTTGLNSPFVLTATSTGNAANTFGPAIEYKISDCGVGATRLGVIGIERNGADNTGQFHVNLDSGGTLATRFSVNACNQAVFHAGAVCKPSMKFTCAGGYQSGFYLRGGNNIQAVTNSIAMWNIHEANGGFNIEFGDTGNSKGDRQMTLNQGCKDNEIFALKSCDVAHGITNYTETDTYFEIKKYAATSGGAYLRGYKDSDGIASAALALHGFIGEAANTAKSTCGHGIVHVDTLVKSGSGGATPGSDANLFSIAGNNSVRHVFDVEGTAHHDVGTATYDDYCDVELLRGLLATTCDRYKDNYINKFGQDLMYNQKWYEDNKILGKCSIHYETRECGRVQQRAMLNFTGLTMLHHSTIIQLADRLTARIDGIETQLTALSEGK